MVLEISGCNNLGLHYFSSLQQTRSANSANSCSRAPLTNSAHLLDERMSTSPFTPILLLSNKGWK